MKHIDNWNVVVADEVVDEWAGIHNDWLIDKIIQQAETFNTNSSLMVYTSSVNSTNIKDRAMNAKQELNKVNKEINELMGKLHSEAKRVGSVLLTADLTVELLDNEEDIFSDAWLKVQEVNRRAIDAAEKGKTTKDVAVYAQPLESAVFGGGVVRISEKFMDIHEDFSDYIEETYAVPLQKLNAKRAALKKAVEAERALSQL